MSYAGMFPCEPARTACADTVTCPYVGGFPAGITAAWSVITATLSRPVRIVPAAMVCMENEPLYNVTVPTALVASWRLFPVAETLVLCESVSSANDLPRTWIAVMADRLCSTGTSVTIADGLKSGRRRETPRKERQSKMVKGISNQYGFCFGGVRSASGSISTTSPSITSGSVGTSAVTSCFCISGCAGSWVSCCGSFSVNSFSSSVPVFRIQDSLSDSEKR